MPAVGPMATKSPDLLRLKIRSTFGDTLVDMLSGETVKRFKRYFEGEGKLLRC